MADWRQIQARIRKAKGSADPGVQLGALYEKTHDAMVAYELGQLHEKAGQNEEAVRWYTAAAERFRRPQWKTKAQEALTRLGAPIPASIAEPAETKAEFADAGGFEANPEGRTLFPNAPAAEVRPSSAEALAADAASPGSAAAPTAGAEALLGRKRRRRGRRGGRGRRRGKPEVQPAPTTSSAQPSRASTVSERPAGIVPAHDAARAPVQFIGETERGAREPSRTPDLAAAPAAWQVRGRAGEPALASRLVHLESQLRRLLASSLYRLDDADEAPAGPGVFIISDSDQTTYFHVESCQTLRVGVANLLRAERGARRGGDSLRARFADNLGITEARVAKYLKDHCAVRWLQLDEGANLLAHFTVAVLRPVLDD